MPGRLTAFGSYGSCLLLRSIRWSCSGAIKTHKNLGLWITQLTGHG